MGLGESIEKGKEKLKTKKEQRGLNNVEANTLKFFEELEKKKKKKQ
jgi:hypothetical protein